MAPELAKRHNGADWCSMHCPKSFQSLLERAEMPGQMIWLEDPPLLAQALAPPCLALRIALLR